MIGLLEVVGTRITSVTAIPYTFGSTREKSYPRITGVENDLAGSVEQQANGPSIQSVMLRFTVRSTNRAESKTGAEALVSGLLSASWKPNWDGGQLIDTFQSGVITTEEAPELDSDNRVVWESTAVIEFMITRE